MENERRQKENYNFPAIKPPKEAYLYFPIEAEQYKQVKKDKISRYYFDGQIQLTNFEHEKLQIFRKYLEEKRHDCCQSEFWTNSMKLRFFAAHNYERGNTVKSIKEYNEWRLSHQNIKIDNKLQQHLDDGIIYLCGRDHRFRPLIILNVYKLNGKDNQLSEILKVITYFLDVVMENMFLPGQIENWVIICDFNSLGLTNLPMNAFKKIIQYLMDNYKSRLHRLYVVNCTGSISIPWTMIKSLLDENTIEKVMIEKTNEPKNIWTHANKKQIEKKFGGELENINIYWPPKIYNEDIYLESDKKDEFLMPAEIYKTLYEAGELKKNKVCEELIN